MKKLRLLGSLLILFLTSCDPYRGAFIANSSEEKIIVNIKYNKQNEEIKSYIARGDDLNSVSLDKNNTYNLYKSFQKVEVIFNYYSTAKSGDNTGNFKAVAAMKCYNINFSCGKK